MFIPEAKDKDVGTSVAVQHAQKIVDAFNRALQDNNCMSIIPMAIYTESDLHINTLEDMGSALGGNRNSINPRTAYPQAHVAEDEDSTSKLLNSLMDSIKNKMGEQCIDCGWNDFPELDIGDIFGDIIAGIRAFIDSILNNFNGIDSSICHFAYLLSYVCVPDLIKILALLIGYLIKLMTKILLNVTSLMSFIFAIIGKIVDAILSYILSVIQWAIGPIGCLLLSLSEIIESLPSGDNLRNGLSQEHKDFVYKSTGGSVNIPAGKTDVTTPTSNYLRKLNSNIGSSADQFGGYIRSARDDIKLAMDSIKGTMGDVTALVNYIGCEGDRSGATTIGEHIDTFTRITQLINLIRIIIKKKSLSEAAKEICNNPDKTRQLANGLTLDDIVSAIEEATNTNGEIIESDDGIGILLTPSDGESSGLNIFSCNLNDFIKNSTLDNVITEGIILAEELRGSGQDPQATVIPRRNIDTLSDDEANRMVIFDLDIVTEVGTFNIDDPEDVSGAELSKFALYRSEDHVRPQTTKLNDCNHDDNLIQYNSNKQYTGLLDKETPSEFLTSKLYRVGVVEKAELDPLITVTEEVWHIDYLTTHLYKQIVPDNMSIGASILSGSEAFPLTTTHLYGIIPIDKVGSMSVSITGGLEIMDGSEVLYTTYLYMPIEHPESLIANMSAGSMNGDIVIGGGNMSNLGASIVSAQAASTQSGAGNGSMNGITITSTTEVMHIFTENQPAEGLVSATIVSALEEFPP